MKNSLQNQRVLFVAPQFFGYEAEIHAELIRRGAHVDFLLDRPFSSPFMKALTRLCRPWVIGAADRYYKERLKSFDGDNYDYVFVVNGQTLSESTLISWRRRYPNAVFILYMWDSFGNRQSIIDNLKHFDFKFTFERHDSIKYGLHFRPLFFSPGFERAGDDESKYDISFIGTAHSDRYGVISEINKSLDPNVRAYWYLFLQAKWVFWVYRFINSGFKTAKLSSFKFEPLSKLEVQTVFSLSRIILDIEHPKQSGLTMRTLETLGARKKMITTNKSIKEYDFYSEDNICVIDRLAPVVPSSFFDTKYRDINPKIYQSYRLEGWLDEILGAVHSDTNGVSAGENSLSLTKGSCL